MNLETFLNRIEDQDVLLTSSAFNERASWGHIAVLGEVSANDLLRCFFINFILLIKSFVHFIVG